MTEIVAYCANPILSIGLRSIVTGLSQSFTIHGQLDVFKSQLHEARPGVALVDASPSVTVEVLRDLLAASPSTPLVLWMDQEISTEYARHALELGVRGFLCKIQSVELHLECLQAVAAGRTWVDQSLGASLLTARQIRLSPRERELMGLLAQGLRNKEIAWGLGISEATVKIYLSKLYFKLGVGDRFELAIIALRHLFPNPSRSTRNPTTGDQKPVPYPFPKFIGAVDLGKATGAESRNAGWTLPGALVPRHT